MVSDSDSRRYFPIRAEPLKKPLTKTSTLPSSTSSRVSNVRGKGMMIGEEELGTHPDTQTFFVTRDEFSGYQSQGMHTPGTVLWGAFLFLNEDNNY